MRNQAVEVALDRLPFGMVIIADAAGRALIVNRAAEEMAAANDGFLLRGGCITAARTKEAEALTRCIAEAARPAGRRNGEGGGSLSISRPSGRRPFALLAAPLSSHASLAAQHQVPAARILITDLERRLPSHGFSLVFDRLR
jgi:hypothetical protein